MRPFQNPADIDTLGHLLRTAYAVSKAENAWSFAQYDIWAQRRLADAQHFGDSSWQTRFTLAEDENSEIHGAIFAHSWHHFRQQPSPHTLILDPAHPQLAVSLLSHAESYTQPEVEAKENNRALSDLLKQRGYNRSADFMLCREKPLTATPPEEVKLPAGFSIQTLQRADWPDYFQAVHAVFGMLDNPASFHSIQQAPSALPELHLIVRSAMGEIAAFSSVWLDRQNQVAEFEPVGTLPHFQKKGLASALLAESCNRLRAMQCPRVTVESWSQAPAANHLYEANALYEVDRVYSWKKAAS